MRTLDLLERSNLSPRRFREGARRGLLGARVFANLADDQESLAAILILEHLIRDDHAWDLVLAAAWRPARE